MTENIVKFMQAHYSDERLAALQAHCEDGKLVFLSCCCFVGIVTADHALRGVCRQYDEQPHYIEASNLPGAFWAETEIFSLADSSCRSDDERNHQRREKLLPLILAEQERREKLKAEPEALLVAASVAQ